MVSICTIKKPHSVSIHPSSSMFSVDEELPRWLMYHELVQTSKEFMRQVTPIKPAWLAEVAPHYFKSADLDDREKQKGAH